MSEQESGHRDVLRRVCQRCLSDKQGCASREEVATAAACKLVPAIGAEVVGPSRIERGEVAGVHVRAVVALEQVLVLGRLNQPGGKELSLLRKAVVVVAAATRQRAALEPVQILPLGADAPGCSGAYRAGPPTSARRPRAAASSARRAGLRSRSARRAIPDPDGTCAQYGPANRVPTRAAAHSHRLFSCLQCILSPCDQSERVSRA